MGAAARSDHPLETERYTVFSEIASGGTGAVHFARLRGEGGFARSVVIKRMHRAVLGDPDLVAMFLDEARTAARVQHPNVVATLDVVDSQGDVLVVMEYVDGESLERLLGNAPRRSVSPRIAASIVAGFLHGLHAAHEATDKSGESLELVHRDVSPGNILVGVDGTARILDFGIAKAIGRVHVTREGIVKGKLAYMPPEQLYGEALDRRTDVYAAGVVLWEMLTGRRLFGKSSEADTIAHILNAPVVPPGDISSDLRAFDAVVLRALARNPDDRFETAQAMAVSLERGVHCAAPSEVGAWVESAAAEALAERARALAEMESASLRPKRAPAEPHPRASRAVLVAVVCAACALALVALTVRMRDGESARSATAARPPEIALAPALDPTPLARTNAAASTSPSTSPLTSPPIQPHTRSPASSTADAGARVRKPSPQTQADECSMPYVMDSEGRRHYKPACLR